MGTAIRDAVTAGFWAIGAKGMMVSFLSSLAGMLLLVVGSGSIAIAAPAPLPQVGMVKKAMPAVVGIGVDKRTRIGFRFAGDNSFWEEFQKQYKREEKEFRKKGKPQWDPKSDSVTLDDIAVVGSGFFVDETGTVVTAEHVIEGHRQVYVTTWDKNIYRARVTRSSQENDVAVLKVEGGNGPFPFMPLADSEAVEIAEPVIAIGNPFGITFTVTSGIVSALNRSLGEGTSGLIQTDAPLNPGNSGGPLLNMDGEVIGVSHAIYTPATGQGGKGFNVGLAFAVPSNRVKELMRGKDEAEGMYIGIRLKGDGSPVVDSVDVGSPAHEAGLKPDDRILFVDGRKVNSSEDLLKQLSSKRPGKAVSIRLKRLGETISITIVPGRKE
ncbi:trypsin-like peptidase domain-containing protein [Geobacter hydrogenophilus]|uniref:PDZ domain-containing protein n=1 Tax=Geobacter hydrogenophilus TaxID=40983 RepID=A0A9W6FXV2_9BACT|nr:trypsin-like peptidase domain-containing protein [Geobacter hydrogenophilus]MBT0895057.1 trypsin-like peptidase domain-containing protein [Geobacter hydrogenophilus]GLI36881.1 hypothetical protein GHYDROH2_03820 [Geobacter hydrogenophilus]